MPESIAIGYALRKGRQIAPITSFFPKDMLVEALPNAITFEKYPELMDNAESQDLVDSVAHYRDVLGQLDEPFPADFPLWNLLDKHYKGQQIRDQVKLLQGRDATDGKKADDAKPEEKKEDEKKEDAPKADEKKPEDKKPDEKKPG